MNENRPEFQGAQPLRITCTGKMGPVPDGSAATECIVCAHLITPGQYFTTLPVGCGDDPENRRLARMALPFSIIFRAAHFACVTGDESMSRLSVP